MRTLLLMQTGDMPGLDGENSKNFDRLFLRMADYGAFAVKVVKVFQGEEPGSPLDYAGVIVTGSPAMVTDKEAWSEKSGRWLGAALNDDVPVLGVCYGHQLLAQATGGEVDFHPDGMELGTHQVCLNTAAANHPLLAGLSDSFFGNLAHSQTVVRPPEGAEVLGCSRHDPHQILSYGGRSLSLQFHPEFDADVMLDYVKLYTGPGNRHQAMRLGVPLRDTPLAASILQRFIDSCE